MTMHDIISHIGIAQCLMPQTIQSAALDSGSIDTQGAQALAVAVLVGDIDDTLSSSARIDLKIEHADDDGSGAPESFAACTAADVLTPQAQDMTGGIFATVDSAAKAQSRHVVGYRGGKRFVKVTATPAGLSNGGAIAMVCLTGALNQMPADNGQ
jgi:hypothetical protein